MKLLVLLSPLLICGLSIDVRHDRDYSQQHQVSDECCTKSGGSLCGKVFKSCCTNKGCKSGYFFSETCADKLFAPTCKTCSEECLSRNGNLCGIEVSTGKIDCCATENCIKQKKDSHQFLDSVLDTISGQTGKCADGKAIQIPTDCIPDSYSTLISGRLFTN